MSEERLVVQLDGARAGELTEDRNGRLEFDYDDTLRERPHPTPLSLSMPLIVRRHGHGVVTAFLFGLLPDNATILERWAGAYHVSANNPFALISRVGEDCADAVQFVRPERVDSLEPGSVEWLSDDQVAERLRELRRDPSAWQRISDNGQFSLAGAQAKTAPLLDDGRWGIPSGAMPTTHILKPAIEGFDDHDLNEYLCLQTASRLGLNAARSELTEIAGERAIVIRRYDRAQTDDPKALRRIHQEDFCQAFGVPPRAKYEADGGPSFATMTTLLREYQTSDFSAASAWRLVDAAALNWVLAGTDAHAKNYSLLLSGDDTRLAPLYDVASALPYDRIDPLEMKLAMKVGGRYEVRHIVSRHWRRHAENVGLDADQVIERVGRVATNVTSALADSCDQPAIRSLRSDLPARLLDRVADHSQWCTRMLEG